MKPIQPRFKPLYSRMLGLGIANYLLSRDFELASIEMDIDYSWNSNWNELTRGKFTYNSSIVAEEAFGGVISDITHDFGTNIIVKNEFIQIITYILKDFAKWSNIKIDFSKVFESLFDLDFKKEDLESYQKDILKIQYGKPLKIASIDNTQNFEKEFWKIIHPEIVSVSKKRFDDGYYRDSVFSAITEVNYKVKKIVKNKTSEEMEGVSLMRKAFGTKEPTILFVNSFESKVDNDIQEGLMQLFAGTCQCIRNPHAHKNDKELDKDEAVHYLFLISLLMNKLDSAKY